MATAAAEAPAAGAARDFAVMSRLVARVAPPAVMVEVVLAVREESGVEAVEEVEEVHLGGAGGGPWGKSES